MKGYDREEQLRQQASFYGFRKNQEEKESIKKLVRKLSFAGGIILFSMGAWQASSSFVEEFKEKEKDIARLQKSYDNKIEEFKNLEDKNKNLEKIIEEILPKLENRIASIEESDPGIMWDAENLINKLRGGYNQEIDLRELESLVTIIPNNITRAQHTLLERKHGINLYKPTESFIKNHLANNGHTYVTSEQGQRTHVKFNVNELDIRDIGGNWFYIDGELGSWKKETVKGMNAFVRDIFHNAIDLFNSYDKSIFVRHEGEIVLFEDFHSDGIEDPYNDPLGRSCIYGFEEEGKKYRVQLSHLNDELPIKFKPGDKVYPGDILGIIGKTGFATGPHLDVRYFKKENNGWKELILYSNRTFNPGENFLYVDWINKDWRE